MKVTVRATGTVLHFWHQQGSQISSTVKFDQLGAICTTRLRFNDVLNCPNLRTPNYTKG